MDQGPFQNIHLHRIWWCLNAPSFLSLVETVDYFKDQQHRDEVHKILLALDEKAEAVDAHFQSLGRIPLGRYFEQLIIFILERDPYYELLEANYQVIEEKVTLGELDIVVFDRVENENQHWELALKYYLQTGNTGDHDNFLGPSRRDYLGRKMKQLFGSQLALSQHRQILERYGPMPAKLFLKGELFYPFGQQVLLPESADKQAKQARWLSYTQFRQRLDEFGHRFGILIKPDWLAPAIHLPMEESYSAMEVIEALRQAHAETYRPQLVASLLPNGNGLVEKARYFVCPDPWPLEPTDPH